MFVVRHGEGNLQRRRIDNRGTFDRCTLNDDSYNRYTLNRSGDDCSGCSEHDRAAYKRHPDNRRGSCSQAWSTAVGRGRRSCRYR
jgi:hypothetical protein